MSKYEEYQDVLDYMETILDNCDYSSIWGAENCNCSHKKICLERVKKLNLLKELVGKEKVSTLEEVKREWEALGYKWIENKDSIDLLNESKEEIIVIDKENKRFAKTDDRVKIPLFINWKEYQLITKTMKALGWM